MLTHLKKKKGGGGGWTRKVLPWLEGGVGAQTVLDIDLPIL